MQLEEIWIYNYESNYANSKCIQWGFMRYSNRNDNVYPFVLNIGYKLQL